VWNLKLGKLNGACVATRIRRYMRNEAVLVVTGFVDGMVMERFDQLIGINVFRESHFAS
jgi:hypothetical protein